MKLTLGDIYWLRLSEDVSHPQVVITIDSSVMVTVVALTTNMLKVSFPGNILLDPGEGGLTKRSIIEVSKRLTINKSQLSDYVGRLSEQRLNEILAGINFVQTSFLSAH